MNNHNYPQTPHHNNHTTNYSITNPQNNEKIIYQYNSPNYSNSLSAGKMQQGGQGYATRGYDQEFKERNRTMYNSSMDFGGSGTSNPSLNSFGRQVGEPANFRDQH